jgi:predicted PurR-regulated permease PerM
MPEQRLVSFQSRSVLRVVGMLLALATALWVLYTARQVLTWVLVSIFLALALNPAVERLQQPAGFGKRGMAAAVIYLIAIGVLVGLGFLLIPPVADQVSKLADAAPGYVHDLTRGHGPLGFLETKYHVVEKLRKAVKDGGGGASFATSAGTALSITRSVVTAIVGVVTIAFMTFFMILEGPAWMDRLYSLLPPESEPRWRNVGQRVAQTVSGYVTGNLLISLIAGVSASIVLAIMGVPYALALGFVVALLDLIPLAGATLAGIIIVTVAFLTSVTAGIVVLVFFVLYQQLENHLLQPLVYGRTVQLSPLAVLISVLIGAEVAGVLGALGAIPIAGAMQILLVDWREHRRHGTPPPTDPTAPGAAPAT